MGSTEIKDNRAANSGPIVQVGTGVGALNDISITGIAFGGVHSQTGYAQLYIYGNVTGIWVYGCVFNCGAALFDAGIEAAPTGGGANASNVYIDHCAFSGAGVADIYLQQVQGESVIFACQIGTSNGKGIWLYSNGAGPFHIIGVNATNCSTACNLTALSQGLNDVHISNSSFTQSTSYGFAITGTKTVSQVYVDNCALGSSPTNSLYITAQCQLVMFSNCSIQKADGDGVYINPLVANHPWVQFTGCVITRNNGVGINVAGTSYLSVEGCNLGDGTYYAGDPTQTYGMNFSGTANVGNLLLIGNDFTGNVTGAIQNPGNMPANQMVRANLGYENSGVDFLNGQFGTVTVAAGSGIGVVTGSGTITVSVGVAAATLSAGLTAASNASTVMVAGGFQVPFTPAVSGKIKVTITGNANTAVGAATASIEIYTGTTALSNAASLSGGAVIGSVRKLQASGDGIVGAFAVCAITTVAVGTIRYIDVGYETSNASDAVTLNNVDVLVEELPA